MMLENHNNNSESLQLEQSLFLLQTLLGDFLSYSDNNYYFKCKNPNCRSITKSTANKSHKLSIKIYNNGQIAFHCWVCGKSGYGFSSLIKQYPLLSSEYSVLLSIHKEFLENLEKHGNKHIVETLTLNEEEKLYHDYISDLKNHQQQFIPLSILKYLVQTKDKQLQKILKNTTDQYYDYCVQNYNKIVQYLKSRKINEDSWSRFGICWQHNTNYISYVSHSIFSNLPQINYYILNSFVNENGNSLKYVKAKNSKYSKELPFFEYINPFSNYLILVEGLYDFIALNNRGFNSLPMFGSNVNDKFVTLLINNLMQMSKNVNNNKNSIEHIILIPDNDDTGKQQLINNIKTFRDYGISVKPFLISDYDNIFENNKIKDVDEINRLSFAEMFWNDLKNFVNDINER